jgi:transaldolase
MATRLEQLTAAGVSVWCDSIARDWLEKGELRRLRDEFSVRGVTSNPTIFQKAMGEGSFYDQEMAALAKQGNDGKGIFEKMALTDIRAAAKDMAPVAEASGGVDGRVSFEVSPDLARDTDETYEAATRLYRELDLPNVLIKIPATAEGVPAIRRSIASGVSVNVTLIFSIARYREVMEAYLSGLEELAEAGGNLADIASVASFFISRVDSNVDKKLQAIVDEGGADAEKARARLGTTAIDNGKLAYEAFQQTFSGPRWEALASKGAHVQRPLWASTSTKNPDYRDVLYVEELIAPHTVNTMPLETIEAFQDHGEVRGATATQGMDRAHALWSDLAALGIDEATVGKELEDEGVDKFEQSYNDAIETVENKVKKLKQL